MGVAERPAYGMPEGMAEEGVERQQHGVGQKEEGSEAATEATVKEAPWDGIFPWEPHDNQGEIQNEPMQIGEVEEKPRFPPMRRGRSGITGAAGSPKTPR